MLYQLAIAEAVVVTQKVVISTAVTDNVARSQVTPRFIITAKVSQWLAAQ